MTKNILSAGPVFLQPGDESAAFSPDQRVSLAIAANCLKAHRHGAELTGCLQTAARACRKGLVARAEYLDLAVAILGPGCELAARRAWLDTE